MDQITLLTVSADTWLTAMAETTLRTSVMLLVSGGVALGLRRGAATLRHLVWALALAGVLLAPLSAAYLPGIEISVPALPNVLATPSEPGRSFGEPREVQPHVGPYVSRSAAGVARSVPGAALTSVDRASDTAPADAAVAAPSGVVVWPGPRRLASASTVSLVGLGLWLAGAAMLLVRLGVALVVTRRLRRSAALPRDAEWARLAAELTDRLGLTRPVLVLSSPHAAMPMTWGWRRPVVLVPATGDWSTSRKRVVLLHELNHVRRHDCAWQFVANLACAVHWFNPLVWLAVRAQRIERERACDEAVLQAGTQASSYADHLLEIARGHQEPRWSAIAALGMARRSQLEGRLRSILAPGHRPLPSRRTALGVSAAMTALIASLAAVTPSVRAASRGERVSAVAAAEPAAYAEVAVPQTASAPAAPESSPAPVDGRAQPLEDAPGVVATPEAARQPPAVTGQEPRDAEARREDLEREVAALPRAAQYSTGMIGEDLAREVAALESRRRALAGARQLQGGRQDLRVADFEARLRMAHEAASRLRSRQGDSADELERLSLELAERGLEQAFEVQQAGLSRLDGLVPENLHLRLQDELARVQARIAVDRAPLDPRVVDLLLESLSDDDPGVRERAARGLGRNRVAGAVGALVEALRDSDAVVRGTAAWALGRLRAETAVGPLTSALADTEADVVEQAASALGFIGSDAAVAALGGTLGAVDADVRARAAWALGRIRSAEAVPALSVALDDPEPRVRVEVVEALGHIRDATAVAPLVGALADTEPRIRREAAEALGRLRHAGAVDGLIRALADTDPSVVRHAAEALGMIPDAGNAVEGLVGALRHEDADVVEEAAEALGRIRSDAAVDGLAEALSTAEPDAAQEIVEALGRIGGDRSLEALIAVTDDASPALRKAVIEALSRQRWGNRVAPAPNPRPEPTPAREG